MLWNIGVALFVVFLSSTTFKNENAFLTTVVSGILFVLMLLFLLILQLVFSFLYAYTTRKEGVIGEHTLEIREDGLLEETMFNSSLNKWSGLQKIWKSNSFIGIHITDFLVHLIPIVKVKEKEILSDFAHEINRRITNANKAVD